MMVYCKQGREVQDPERFLKRATLNLSAKAHRREQLNNFLHDNPIFSVSAVETPVRIETRSGRIAGLLTTDWEPYAALRSLDKPVDLVVLPYASHVVSMPSDILASQQGEVDWVRFWLQGYEDREAGKADQYRRWEKLCELQGAQNPGRPRWCVSVQDDRLQR